MKRFLLFAITLVFGIQSYTQAIFNTYQQEMNAAYAAYPNVPKGILEGWSFTMTHFSHLDENIPGSCIGIPRTYGVMGLTENGQGYFRNNLIEISNISGYTVQEIKSDPQKNILAFAAAYSELLIQYGITSSNPKDHLLVMQALCEIPYDHNPTNNFALNSHIYSVLKFITKTEYKTAYNIPNYGIDLSDVFGQNLEVLSASAISIDSSVSANGITYVPTNLKSPDYPPALWTATPSCNYSSRNGTAVSAMTIHTIQGTYAGAISWAQNCSANVSYHYVVRSSDGQVTQMVLEADKGWHVGSENPYTIGIEHDGYVSDPSWYTTALYEASADICKDVVNSGYGLNPLRTYYGASSSGGNVLGGCTKIKGHQHYPNQTHTDPGINWDWSRYYHLINDGPSITTESNASGTLYDSGGATGDYTDDERYLWLIQPTGATNVTITFNSFDIEANWDYMLIYDGSSTDDPLLGTYTGTANPGTISSTGDALLIEFRSDCATTSPGWEIVWNSTGGGTGSSDDIAPTTNVSAPNSWETTDFTATFTDADNNGGSGVDKVFYQVIDYDGSDWRANSDNGFFSDNFDQTSIHSDWTSSVGTWNLVNGFLDQSDESEGNTNIYASLNQDINDEWLYHYAINIDGSGTYNRRAGFHFMCDDAAQTERGNSYFVWFRTDDDKVQIYETTNNVFSLEVDEPFTLNNDQWYDIKVTYDKNSGEIHVWVDNEHAASWTDPTPLTSGNAISFRSGNSYISANNIKVYHDRSTSETISVGTNGDIRYQNTAPTIPSGRVKSMIIDSAYNISSVAYADVNVDWTVPSQITSLNDGTSTDIDNQTNNTQISANWGASLDAHSDISRYWYAIGSTSGGTDIVNWTDNWFNTSFTHTGLNLSYGSTYYVSVKTENGAGLINTEVTSDGVTIDTPIDPPVADFNYANTNICSGDSIQLTNSSTDATSYVWSVSGATLSSNTDPNPYISFTSSGAYDVTLIATGPGGSDTDTQTINVTVSQQPNAAMTPSNTTPLINDIVTFTNNSSNANGYIWDFGNGNASTDENPWNTYDTEGQYTVTLIAINGTCPNDTTTIAIDVMDNSSVEELNGVSNISIYPNPSHGQFIINLDVETGDIFKAELFDMTGKRIEILFSQQLTRGANSVQVDLNQYGIAQGVYQLKISNSLGAVHQKIIYNK